MRRKLFYTLLTLIFSINLLHSQAVKHAEFLGIQINGSLESFTLQLENKGFTKNTYLKTVLITMVNSQINILIYTFNLKVQRFMQFQLYLRKRTVGSH